MKIRKVVKLLRVSSSALKLKNLNEKIQKLIEEGGADNLINDLFLEYERLAKTATYYSMKSTYQFQLGNYEKGLDILKEATSEFPFSYNLNYNQGVFYQVLGDSEESAYSFARCVTFSESEEDQRLAKENMMKVLEDIKKQPRINKDTVLKITSNLERILKATDERAYPMNRFGESLIRKVNKGKGGEEYLVNIYRPFYVNDVDIISRYFMKSELLKGKETKEKEFMSTGPVTIPVSFIKEQTDFTVKSGDETLVFKGNQFPINQYNYLTFNEKGRITFKSDKEMFIGNPIALQAEKKSPKLVIYIFIDGLAYSYLESQGKENLMPNTYQYFEKGYINENCFATGDWTMPSVAAMNTGKHTLNHGLFHSKYHKELSDKLLAEYFKEQGYFTTQINNNWRVTPPFGYYKGFDRMMYQHGMGGFGAGETISEIIEHLETFKNQNNYLWVTMQDLHDVPDNIQNDLSTQVKTEARYRQSNQIATTSALTRYDENKMVRFGKEITRLDEYLGVLYRYLDEYYKKEEILLVLSSDHGQAFLEKDSALLHESKRRVPLMMYGNSVPALKSKEFTEIVDILPTLLKLTDNQDDLQGIDGQVMYDFGGEKRRYSRSESFHHDQSYKVAITDSEHIYNFETIEKVTLNGFVDFEKYTVSLVNAESLEDETVLYGEKVDYYTNLILNERIKFQK